MSDPVRSSLELLYNINRELTSSLDLGAVLPRVLSLSTENVSAERGMLIVLDERQNPTHAAIIYNQQLVTHTPEQVSAILEQGLAGWVMRHHEPVLVADTSQDERWLQRPDDSLARSGAKSAICVPLLVAGAPLVGVLTIVHPQPGLFTQEHLSLLQTIAGQAAIAIHNARLYASLQASNRRYRELFEDSIDPILISDKTGKILEANRQAGRKTAQDAANLRSRNIGELLDIPPAEQERSLATANGEDVNYEANLLTGSAHVPVEVHIRSIHFEGQENLQWILRDISERKALDALRSDLIAMIYHDLRSPLSNVISSIDMLNTMLPPEAGESTHTLLAIASRSTSRLQRLISSLLDIHRLEAGESIIHEQTINAQVLSSEAIEIILPQIEARQQYVENHVPYDLPLLKVDIDMIRRVLINLLENATKFTPPNGIIKIGAVLQEGWVCMWVEDSGSGIQPEDQERIFDKFVRLENGHAPKGIGLGLAFCRLAIKEHGGKIWIESHENVGSRFLFTIPVVK